MKKIIALVLCLVMVFALCACGESNTATTAPAADTATEAPAEEPAAAGSVYYLNFKPESDEAWQALAETYTKQTGVPVTVVTAASGTYDQTLTSEMDKSEAPTMFQVGNPGAVATWGEYCLDLTGTDVYNEMTTHAFDQVGDDGFTYSIGYCYECYGIIVNKALLEQAGHSIDEIKDFESLKLLLTTSTPAQASSASTPSPPQVLTAPPAGDSPATLPICLSTTSSAMTASPLSPRPSRAPILTTSR